MSTQAAPKMRKIAMARVYNDGPTEYVEMYKGEMIRVPTPPKFIEMPFFEAVDFKGQFTTPKTENGTWINPKPLRVEQFWKVLPVGEGEMPTFKCEACDKVCTSEEELVGHNVLAHKEPSKVKGDIKRN